MRRFRLLLVALVFTIGTVAAAHRLEVASEKPYDVAIVPSPGMARWLSLGHPTLLANLLWLRTVQYIGEPRADERGWDRLLPLLETVTDLDPGHGYAYQVGGVVLGSVGRTAESNAILEKGTRNVPDRYILPYLRAFNAFYYDDDWAAAGRFAEISARTPGAPPHVRQNVLTYYVKGKRADAAVAFLEQSLAEAKDPDTRKAVEGQLAQARLEQAVARLDDAVDEWRRRYLTGPIGLRQLVDEGLVSEVPPDPAGGELYVGEDGRVWSTALSKRVGRPERARDVSPEPGFNRPPPRGSTP
jgi:tetratricopeptide (TPR) repeat protein